jgi:hypothetical protein
MPLQVAVIPPKMAENILLRHCEPEQAAGTLPYEDNEPLQSIFSSLRIP